MMAENTEWHEGTCSGCGSERDHVRSVDEHGDLCIVCLDRLEEVGDPAVKEVFADA